MHPAVLALSLLLAPAAAPAQPAAAEKPRVTISDKAPEKGKLICERERSADSFISRRVCRTPEQVEALRRAADENTRATQQHYQDCRGRGC
jgi:hypothetical protein